MFNPFKSKQTSYIGMDLGTSSIKLVELENVAGRPQLVTYGSVETQTNVSKSEAKTDTEKIAGIVRALVQKTGARSKRVVAALPNFSVFSSVISLPQLGQKQLNEAVQWEAKKFVPMPIENVVLDWKVLDQVANTPEAQAELEKNAQNQEAQKNAPQTVSKGNLAHCKTIVKILLTAAPKHLVERYVAIFKSAGLELASLETESFALSRSLVGNDPGAILIADIGSLTTDLTVVQKGVPVLARSINVGGNTVTKAIADSMGIAPERAEQFKRDVGLGSIVAASQGEQKNSGVAQIISQSFSAVINEMKYSLELHQSQGTSTIEKVLVTGGSSFLPGLAEYITQSVGIKAYIGSPWARVSYPKDLTEVLDQLAPSMAVSVGLAMREIE